jgi:hypothetical protein
MTGVLRQFRAPRQPRRAPAAIGNIFPGRNAAMTCRRNCEGHRDRPDQEISHSREGIILKMLKKIMFVCVLAVSAFLPDHARAADLDYAPRLPAASPPPASRGDAASNSASPCHSEMPPHPMAFRPAGRPPGYVFYAPSNGRCLPGFFWRVYPDGAGECWPWAN